MKVLLRGPLLTNSGYGVHARQIYESIEKQPGIELSVHCTSWGQCSWLISPEDLNGLVGRIMQRSVPLENMTFDLSIQVQLPDEWDPKLAKRNIGITAAVEATKCHQSWIEKCNAMDKIIVPSTFTQNVIKRSGIVFKPIHVIPEWFNQNILNKSVCDKIRHNDPRYKIDTKFNFLVMGLITGTDAANDRKNLFNTIKWLMEEFKDDPDVGIVLKTSFGKSTKFDKKMTLDFLKQVIENCRIGANPKIHLLHGHLTSQEIAALYHTHNIKSLVTATRGEGYGLPIVDAAAAAMPIVATDWSGHFEYLDRDLIFPVEYDLIDLPKSKIDGRIFVEGSKWAEPRESSFKSSVRKIYQDYKPAKENAKKLQKTILSNYNKLEITKMYQKVFFR